MVFRQPTLATQSVATQRNQDAILLRLRLVESAYEGRHERSYHYILVTATNDSIAAIGPAWEWVRVWRNVNINSSRAFVCRQGQRGPMSWAMTVTEVSYSSESQLLITW